MVWRFDLENVCVQPSNTSSIYVFLGVVPSHLSRSVRRSLIHFFFLKEKIFMIRYAVVPPNGSLAAICDPNVKHRLADTVVFFFFLSLS